MISQRKKIDKIYGQIDKIAKKGKDYVLEYYKLIDEIVDKGDYAYLEQCLIHYYEIDIINYPSVTDVKKKTWSDIRFRTISTFMQKLYSIYKSKGVYQISYDIYLESNNLLLGQIMEKEEFTQDSKYLIENQKYSKLANNRIVYLEVTKGDDIIIVNDNDDNLSIEQNLLNRYTKSINILITI